MTTKLEQELQLQVDELKKALSGNHEHSWYQMQIAERDKRIQELFDKDKAREEIESNRKIEVKVKANDEKAAVKLSLREYNQSAHTRFRLTDTPIKLDIFGQPDTPVFDCGVNLSMYDGPIYLPLAIVVEMAQSIGMHTEEQVASLKASLSLAEKKINRAVELTKELTNVTIQNIADEFSNSLDTVIVDSSVSDNGKSEADSGNAVDSSKTGGQASGDNSLEKSDGISNGSGDELDADSVSDDGQFEFPK